MDHNHTEANHRSKPRCPVKLSVIDCMACRVLLRHAGRPGQLPTANQQHVNTSTPAHQTTTSNSSGPIWLLYAQLTG